MLSSMMPSLWSAVDLTKIVIKYYSPYLGHIHGQVTGGVGGRTRPGPVFHEPYLDCFGAQWGIILRHERSAMPLGDPRPSEC